MSNRSITAVALVVAILLFLPSVGAGFFNDDWFHVLELEGKLGGSRIWDLYRYTGAPNRAGPIQGDFLPWWTDAAVKLVLFRPIPSLSLALDHALFGRNPLGYHA